jgi:hypothetical protein
VKLEGCIAFAEVGMPFSLHSVDQGLIADHRLTKIPTGIPLRRTDKPKADSLKFDRGYATYVDCR